MTYKLKLINVWVSADVTQDGISLINMIRIISNKHNESKQEVKAIVQLDKRIFFTYQTPDILNTEYLDQFKAWVGIIEACGGTTGAHPGLSKDLLADMPGVDMST